MVAPELGAAHLPPRGPAGDQLAGRLGVARDDGFVGRGRELELLSDALTGTSDIRVMFVHGPGGIGKTTLLDAMARRTRTGGRQVTYLDGRDVECSPAAVLAAVRERTVDDPSAVLLVDGYELLTPLDRWFRTEFLPARPADAVTVVAGREAPAAAWWLDPGWRRLVSVHGLEELDAADSRDLLLGLGVTDQVDRLAELGPGYPLALAMLAVVILYLTGGTGFAAQGVRHLRMLWPFLLLIAVWHGATGQVQAGLAIALRLLAALALANFVTMTTRLTDMIAVLTWLLTPLRRLGLSTRAVELAIAMVLRFTPMLVENGQRLAMSWRARSRRRPGWRIVMPMAALALDDADHVAEALRARGGILPDTGPGRG